MDHPKQYSQSELSRLLGYKSGQFISNVERGLCSIPPKVLTKVSQVLNIHPKELKQAILKDQGVTLDSYLPVERYAFSDQLTDVEEDESFSVSSVG